MPRTLNSEIIHAQLYRSINQTYTRQNTGLFTITNNNKHYKNNHQRKKKQSQFNTRIHTLFLSTVSPTTTTFSTRVQPTNHTHLKTHTNRQTFPVYVSPHSPTLNHQINRLIFRHPQLYYSKLARLLDALSSIDGQPASQSRQVRTYVVTFFIEIII